MIIVIDTLIDTNESFGLRCCSVFQFLADTFRKFRLSEKLIAKSLVNEPNICMNPFRHRKSRKLAIEN